MPNTQPSHNISLTVNFSNNYKQTIMDLADEMAAASSERNAQSYDALMKARKQLEAQLNKKVDIHTGGENNG